MGWVVNTIAKLILSVLCTLFGMIAEEFITSFGIDIGATFPTVLGNSTSLVTVLNTYGKTSGLSSVFDSMFPVVAFKKLFVGMAMVIATALFVFELIKALSSPVTGGKRQHPASSLAKFVGATFGIFFSYRLFICMEYIGNEFYRQFGKVAIDNMNNTGGESVSSMFNGAGSTLFDALYFVGDTVGDVATGMWVVKGIAATIFNLIIVWLVFVNFIRLLIEVLERYVVLGALFYTAPLPFATLASEETRHIFSAWIKMSISQMMLIITNGLFISVFIAGLLKLNKVNAGNVASAAMFGGRISWAIYMMVLVGWLLLAQRFDSYLNSLGLSTAQTGGGLASAVRSGVLAVGGVAKGMTRAYNGSDLKSNLKAARTGFGAGSKADVAKNSISNSAKQTASRIGGRDATSTAQAQRSMNESRRLSNDLAKAGRNDLAQKMMTGNIAGQEAREAGSMLAPNKAAQKMIDEGSNHKWSRASDGSNTLSFTTKDGEKAALSFGGDGVGKIKIGSAAGLDVSAKGSMSALDKLASEDGKSLTATGAASFAKENGSNWLSGTLKDGSAAVKNTATGEVRQFGLEGSSDMYNAKSLGNGYVTGNVTPTMAKSFQDAGYAQRLETGLHSMNATLQTKGFDNVAAGLSAPGNISHLRSDLPDSIGMNNKAAMLIRDANSMISNDNNSFTTKNMLGGEIQYTYADSEASGSSIVSQYGDIKAIMKHPGSDQQDGARFLDSLGGISGEKIESVEGFLSTLFTDQFESAKADVNYRDPSYNIMSSGLSYFADESAKHTDICGFFELNGQPVAEITRNGIAEGLEGDWIRGDDDYAIRLTDEGKGILQNIGDDRYEAFVDYAEEKE